jgi:hypothetical protein
MFWVLGYGKGKEEKKSSERLIKNIPNGLGLNIRVNM